jgi:carbon-monoxide dehydrogenase medium subunit
MKPAQFSYFRPRNAAEAIDMIAVAGDDARFVAGGQSLVPMMNFRIVRPSALIDLSDCADLVYVKHHARRLHIGAMVRQRDAENDTTIRQHCPLIAQALAHAGPATIRNRATIGGTIANGYPLAQLTVVALCLGAEIVLASQSGQRTVASSDFFIAGMVTAIKSGELLREIVVPARGPHTRYAFIERGNHASGAALAIVAICVEMATDGRFVRTRVAAAGLQSIPVLLSNVGSALTQDNADLHKAFAADLQFIDENGEGGECDVQQRNLVRLLIEDAVVAISSEAVA